MKVYFHYCLFGFSNCYILGKVAEKTGDRSLTGVNGEVKEALLIDPGCADENIINFIEKNDYSLKGILITHDHYNHVHGLRTLKNIYDAEIYAVNPIVCELRTNLVRDGDTIQIGSFTVSVYSIPGHTSDSAVYRIDHLLFTGDVISAGLVGSTASSYGAAIQDAALRSKLFSLPGDFTILPGHGPPSTLEVERRFNVGMEKTRKPTVQRSPLIRDF